LSTRLVFCMTSHARDERHPLGRTSPRAVCGASWLLAILLVLILVAAPACRPERLLPAAGAPAAGSAGAYQEGRVVHVVDGDTIDVQLGGRRVRVRYIGINAPESADPRRPVECFGREAAAKNKELVDGKVVRLERDVSETDRYGRLLRYVYVGELFVNAELVRLGYAQAVTYPPDVKYQELFLTLEREAREAGRGLWGACRR